MPFQKGNKLGGRPKGAPNKLTMSVKEALQYAFDGMGGAEKLMEWAKDNKNDFYRLWIKMLPSDLKVSLDLDDRLGEAVRSRLNEIDTGDAGQPRETGGDVHEDVEHAPAPEAHQPAPPEDGAGEGGPA